MITSIIMCYWDCGSVCDLMRKKHWGEEKGKFKQ